MSILVCDILFPDNFLDKTIFQPASRLEKLMEGLLGSSGGFGRKFSEGDLNFLEVALVWKFPYGNLPKQSFKKFASEPPKLLRSPSRSGSMQKLVAELSYLKNWSFVFAFFLPLSLTRAPFERALCSS